MARQINRIPIWIWLWGAILMMALIQLVILSSQHHFAYNIEPYPDTWFYAIGGRNLAQGRGLNLVYQESVTAISIPKAYPFYLWLVNILIDHPLYFIIGNTILAGAAIWLLFEIIKKAVVKGETKQNYLYPMGLGLYLLHGFILWIPQLAMIENLGLVLIMAICYVLLVWENNWQQWLSLIGLGAICIITKYTYVPIFFILVIIVIFKIWQQKKYLWLGILAGLGTVLAGGVWWWQPELLKSISYGASQLFSDQNEYFSIIFLPNNLINLGRTMMGGDTPLLWLSHPLTSLLIGGGALYLIAKNWGDKNKRLNNIYLILIALIILPLQLIFYVYDNRYLSQLIPLLVVIIIYNWRWPLEKEGRRNAIAVGIMAMLGLWFLTGQAGWYRKIVVDNFLYRSVAWQKEAVMFIGEYFENQENQDFALITNISPFYYDYYGWGKSEYLPLAPLYEYQGTTLWREKYDWEKFVADPVGFYTDILEAGKELYLTNAYVTNAEYVINHNELYKAAFELELVQVGCDQACNIYKVVGLKNHE